MPGGDRTGPLGQGPMSGRGFGRGRGFGMGRGMGFGRRGIEENEVDMLRREARQLESSLKEVNDRLEQLGNGTEKA
ncbi:MAG: DUF5320 domain-containing protein [bacterium]|nr:DUF5320 domain-containing protein [bacterium]